ncbi:MAG: NADH-quinone oxidoreductase subunit [Pseudonocardiales bacterium]|nr:NADH-quinone oxidoreductase subunit [Pseudonocardiales bacterium]
MHDVSLLGLLAVPLLGSLLIFALPAGRDLLAKQIALAASVLTFGYAVVLGVAFKTTENASRFQFNGSWVWIKNLGVHFAFGLDGIALVLIAMATLLVPCVVLSSWHTFDSVESAEELRAPTRSPKAFFGLVLLLEVFMIGVFAATDVFLFYVFFEAMLVPMYFIIGSFGGPRRQYAAMKFFLYSLVGGLLMLASVIGVYVSSGTSSFAFTDLVGHIPNGASQKWLFLGFFIAFAIKAPLFPFHTWLPDAGAEAPAGGAALLVGVLDKVGTFGFLRYCLPLFPQASRDFAMPILILSVIGVLYAAFLAMGQRDMKRLVAYTSVAHFGFIGLGIFAFTTQAISGAVLYMVNHGLATALLFLVVGMLTARGGSRNIRDYGGVGKVAPLLGGFFLIGALATIAMPGTNSFVSEFLVLIGTFTRHPAWSIIATTGIVLAAVYMLWIYQRTMTGPVRGDAVLGQPDHGPVPDTETRSPQDRPHDTLHGSAHGSSPVGSPQHGAVSVATPTAASVRVRFGDLSRREVAVLTPLVVLIIFLGLYPKPVLDVINPTAQRTVAQSCHTDPAVAAPAAGYDSTRTVTEDLCQ